MTGYDITPDSVDLTCNAEFFQFQLDLEDQLFVDLGLDPLEIGRVYREDVTQDGYNDLTFYLPTPQLVSIYEFGPGDGGQFFFREDFYLPVKAFVPIDVDKNGIEELALVIGNTSVRVYEPQNLLDGASFDPYTTMAPITDLRWAPFGMVALHDTASALTLFLPIAGGLFGLQFVLLVDQNGNPVDIEGAVPMVDENGNPIVLVTTTTTSLQVDLQGMIETIIPDPPLTHDQSWEDNTCCCAQHVPPQQPSGDFMTWIRELNTDRVSPVLIHDDGNQGQVYQLEFKSPPWTIKADISDSNDACDHQLIGGFLQRGLRTHRSGRAAGCGLDFGDNRCVIATHDFANEQVWDWYAEGGNNVKPWYGTAQLQELVTTTIELTDAPTTTLPAIRWNQFTGGFRMIEAIVMGHHFQDHIIIQDQHGDCGGLWATLGRANVIVGNTWVLKSSYRCSSTTIENGSQQWIDSVRDQIPMKGFYNFMPVFFGLPEVWEECHGVMVEPGSNTGSLWHRARYIGDEEGDSCP